MRINVARCMNGISRWAVMFEHPFQIFPTCFFHKLTWLRIVSLFCLLFVLNGWKLLACQIIWTCTAWNKSLLCVCVFFLKQTKWDIIQIENDHNWALKNRHHLWKTLSVLPGTTSVYGSDLGSKKKKRNIKEATDLK